MKLLHPVPNQVKLLMTDPNVDLNTLDKYLNPGKEGAIFHGYSAKILSKLKSAGINSFIDLKNEFELIQEKRSKLHASIRTLVQGHYTFYVNEFESSVNYYESLNDEQRNSIIDGYYVEEKEDNMKLNLIKINSSIQESGSVMINKAALTNDMDVIHNHYEADILQAPEPLRPFIKDYDPIKFGVEYLSLMLSCKFDVEDHNDNVKLIKIN